MLCSTLWGMRPELAEPPPDPQVVFTNTQWDPEDGRGHAELHHAGQTYAVVDYRDKIPFPGVPGHGLAERLGLQVGEDEGRQCVLKATVAAVLWAREHTAPSMERVERLALEARSELWEAAYDAQLALGEPASLISTAEADLRVFAHDALYPHHDKDVRCVAAFPLTALKGARLHVWLVDRGGALRRLTFSPATGTPAEVEAYVVLTRGHVRAFSPVSSCGEPGSIATSKRESLLPKL